MTTQSRKTRAVRPDDSEHVECARDVACMRQELFTAVFFLPPISRYLVGARFHFSLLKSNAVAVAV